MNISIVRIIDKKLLQLTIEIYNNQLSLGAIFKYLIERNIFLYFITFYYY